MDKPESAFTCIKAKFVVNVQRRVNKEPDMSVLVKCLNIVTVEPLHFTVMLLNIRAQFMFYCFVSAYIIKH